MSNIIDYIKWRGDLTFSQDSFNDIDNLILSQLAYIDFTDIVVPSEISKGIPLKDAADKFFAINDEEEILNHVSMTKLSAEREKYDSELITLYEKYYELVE